jgi:tetratricopeptide (TPR) repeat protein
VEALAIAHRAFLVTTLDPSITEQEALAQATEAMRTLDEMGDRVGSIRAARSVAFLTFVMGDVDESLALDRARYQEAKALGDRREMRRSAPAIGGTLYYGSTPAPQAIEEILRMLPDVADSRIATAEATVQLPGLYAMQGRFDEARRAASESRDIFIAMGNRYRLATRVFWTGPMHMLAGDFDEAERELRESVEMLEAMGDKGFLSTIAVDLALTLIAQDRFEEAEQFARRGWDLGASDDIVTQFEWRGAMALVAAAKGEMEEALELARASVAMVDGTGYLSLRGECRMWLGEVLQMAGDEPAAREAFSAALGMFERKGNLVLAARARDTLSSVGGIGSDGGRGSSPSG